MLTQFWLSVVLLYPQKTSEIQKFQVFLGGIEMQNWNGFYCSFNFQNIF